MTKDNLVDQWKYLFVEAKLFACWIKTLFVEWKEFIHRIKIICLFNQIRLFVEWKQLIHWIRIIYFSYQNSLFIWMKIIYSLSKINLSNFETYNQQ